MAPLLLPPAAAYLLYSPSPPHIKVERAKILIPVHPQKCLPLAVKREEERLEKGVRMDKRGWYFFWVAK